MWELDSVLQSLRRLLLYTGGYVDETYFTKRYDESPLCPECGIQDCVRPHLWEKETGMRGRRRGVNSVGGGKSGNTKVTLMLDRNSGVITAGCRLKLVSSKVSGENTDTSYVRHDEP